MKIKRILAASVMSGMMMLGVSAHASTVDYIFSGVITSCPDTGFLPCGTTMNTGDSVGGFFTIDMAAVVPGGQIGSGDYVDYSLDFGGPLAINSGNSDPISSFLGLDDNLQVEGGSVTFSAPGLFGGSDVTEILLTFGADVWFAEVMVNGENIEIASGVGKLALVPVPGALLMFAPALLGFAGLRRKAA